MRLQICIILTGAALCTADIRKAGWLDAAVDRWKTSFVNDVKNMAPFDLEATIEPTPAGYVDSPDWDFASVSRLLALLGVSESAAPARASLHGLLRPYRRAMMNLPAQDGLDQRRRRVRNRAATFNNRKQSLFKQINADRRARLRNRLSLMHAEKYLARKLNTRPLFRQAQIRPDHIRPDHIRPAQTRPDHTRSKIRPAQKALNNPKSFNSRKQVYEKRKVEKEIRGKELSFKLFPSMAGSIPNNIYYDDLSDYEYESYEYEFYDPNVSSPSPDDGVVVLRNPVEARLPSARISVRLLKEILMKRAEAARIMPTKKTTSIWADTIDNETTTAALSSNASSETTEGTSTGNDTITDDGDAGANLTTALNEDTTQVSSGGEVTTGGGAEGGGADTTPVPEPVPE